MMFLVYDMHENRQIVSIFLKIYRPPDPRGPDLSPPKLDSSRRLCLKLEFFVKLTSYIYFFILIPL